ncbi:MAG TPA: hypothetical protein VGM32_14255 [Rhodopila sp.]
MRGGRLKEKAVDYWLAAGQQALTNSAMKEAVAQLRKGLDVLAGLPDGPWHQQQELDLQVALRMALGATAGFAAAEVEESLGIARRLAEQLERSDYLVPLIFGQWGLYHIRAQHRLALAQGEQLEQIGESRDDATARLVGRSLRGTSRLYLGEFVAARADLESCIGLADPIHRAIREQTVDPYLRMLQYLAVTLAYLGYIDQARSLTDEALSGSRRLGHANTRAGVLCLANWMAWTTCSPVVHIEEFLALATEHGFRNWLGWALAYHGRSLMGLGQAQEGLALLMRGLGNYVLPAAL